LEAGPFVIECTGVTLDEGGVIRNVSQISRTSSAGDDDAKFERTVKKLLNTPPQLERFGKKERGDPKVAPSSSDRSLQKTKSKDKS
jgi:hypothetical protein